MANTNTDGMEVEEPEPVMVILDFLTDSAADLLDVLAPYVVSTRGEPGCRNIDLVASATQDDRIVIIEKWDSAAAQRSHFDSPAMVAMAKATVPLLRSAPNIDLFDGVSMHDLA